MSQDPWEAQEIEEAVQRSEEWADTRPTVERVGAGGSPWVLPDPETEKPPWPTRKTGPQAGRMGYQRASHIGSVLSDDEGLVRWKTREYVLGMAQLHHEGDPGKILDSTVDGIIAYVEEERGMGLGAIQGTLIHNATDEALTHELDPEDLEDIYPEFVAERAAAYLRAVKAAGITEVRSEFEVINDDLGVVGTADRLYEMPDGTLVIGDLKTSNSLALSAVKFSVQLATYATGCTYETEGGIRHQPLTDSVGLDPSYGVIAHIPREVGAPVTLHRVDLVRGLQRARLARAVLAARSTRGLITRLA